MRGRGHPAAEAGSSGQPRRFESHAPGDLDALAPVAEPEPLPLPIVLARADAVPFVGRTAALGQLQKSWHRGGGLLLVTGEPGIGKTRLAARFAAAVHADGGAVLCGHADEETVWPYQPFVEALRHYIAHRRHTIPDAGVPSPAVSALATLLPELEAPDRLADAAESDRNRYQLFEAVVRLLLHAADPAGLLLVLEDLHWADAPTTLLLRHILRRAEGSRLLVVATFDDRQAAGSDPLAELRRDALDTVHLTGMSPDEAAALVAQRAGRQAADDDAVRRLCDETAGNPLFIEELLRSPPHDDGVRVPLAVKHVIGRRFDQLPRAALEVLTLAAVLGRDFSLTALEAVTPDREQDELLDVLEAAVACGLVVEDPEHVDRFSFAHALVRETLYERPIASRRVRLHRRVAEALEFSPLPVHSAELAHHYFEARAVGGADKAILYGLEAGVAAQTTHAYETAVEHYERVLSLLPLVGRDDPSARCDLLLALGTARWQASQPDPRSTFTQALELARDLGLPDRLARAALGAGGRFYAPAATDFAYADLLDQVLADLGPDDSSLRVRVLARLAETLALAQPANALELADEALGMARRLADPAMLTAALMGRHAALLHVEHAFKRRRIGEELLAVSGELADAALGALTRHWLLYDLLELGELDQARARHAELERIAAELQQPLYRHAALAWRGVRAGLAGRFDEAEQFARDSVRLAERAGAPDARTHFTAQLVAVRREQGRLDELLPEVERLAHGDSHVAAWRSLEPLAYLDAGDRARASAAYDHAVDHGTERNMLWLTATASLSEAAAELGDPDEAARLHAELAPYAERLIQWSFTGNAGSVQRLLGRTAAVAGRRDDAREHFEAALACHARLQAPALLARTRCDYGEFLLSGARADRSKAHHLLRAAAGEARRLGMTGVAARAGGHG